MPEVNEVAVDAPIFSEVKILLITEWLRFRVREYMREQSEGKRPYRSRPVIVIMTVSHIMTVLGRKRTTAQKVMKAVRLKCNKKKGEYVTVNDFCEATGLPKEDVHRAIHLLPD